MSKSDVVREMNKHLGEALKLMEVGSADNYEKIKQEMKEFFTKAETIEKIIGKSEVSSLDRVKYNELMAIQEQLDQVNGFLGHFNEEIARVEASIRQAVGETSHLLDFTLPTKNNEEAE